MRAWVRKHGRLLAYLAFTAAFTFGLWRTQVAVHQANVAVAAVCAGQQHNRDVLVELVDKAYAPQAGSFDLRTLPAYAKLSGATQEWVDQFQQLIELGATQGTANDKNRNHVPDPIDKLLAEKVC